MPDLPKEVPDLKLELPDRRSGGIRSNLSTAECAGCRQQGHAGRKTLHQQNPPVLNWRCRLPQVDLSNGRKTVVVVISLLTSFRCVSARYLVNVLRDACSCECRIRVKGDAVSEANTAEHNCPSSAVSTGREHGQPEPT